MTAPARREDRVSQEETDCVYTFHLPREPTISSPQGQDIEVAGEKAGNDEGSADKQKRKADVLHGDAGDGADHECVDIQGNFVVENFDEVDGCREKGRDRDARRMTVVRGGALSPPCEGKDQYDVMSAPAKAKTGRLPMASGKKTMESMTARLTTGVYAYGIGTGQGIVHDILQDDAGSAARPTPAPMQPRTFAGGLWQSGYSSSPPAGGRSGPSVCQKPEYPRCRTEDREKKRQGGAISV